MKSVDRWIIVTGMARSGTTLVDRVLSTRDDVIIHSQPLPLLFVELKGRFLLESRLFSKAGRYPLNDMFGAHFYDVSKLGRYLENVESLEDVIGRVSAKSARFSGQLTPFDRVLALRCATSDLSSFLRCYLAGIRSDKRPSFIGQKEIWIEEFVPYLLSKGFHVILVLRDVRDVITSHEVGLGPQWTGDRKPDLFNVRQWRKSVAFSIECQKHSRFMLVRYEHMVETPERTLSSFVHFLELDDGSKPSPISSLMNHDGSPWRSNSSYGPAEGIFTSSIGSFKKHLSPPRQAWIEALCLPELRHLGYATSLTLQESLKVLRTFDEKEAPSRPELADFLWSERTRREERARLLHLAERRFYPETFIFRSAFERFADIVSHD